MDAVTYALCKGLVAGAQTAAAAANTAAEAANAAIVDIYHDKNFILSVNEDNSLSLTYNDEPEETEE
jgi:hypothetical protein